MNWKQIAAVATVAGVIIVAWFGLWTMMDRRFAELRNDNAALRNEVREDLGKMDGSIDALRNEVREDLEKVDDSISALRNEVREDLGKMDGSIDGLRTDVTGIAEDVGYLRGRIDERDNQRTADQ